MCVFCGGKKSIDCFFVCESSGRGEINKCCRYKQRALFALRMRHGGWLAVLRSRRVSRRDRRGSTLRACRFCASSRGVDGNCLPKRSTPNFRKRLSFAGSYLHFTFASQLLTSHFAAPEEETASRERAREILRTKEKPCLTRPPFSLHICFSSPIRRVLVEERWLVSCPSLRLTSVQASGKTRRRRRRSCSPRRRPWREPLRRRRRTEAQRPPSAATSVVVASTPTSRR